jgi:hypothetical protein
MKKSMLTVLLLVAPVFPQDQAAVARTAAGCGPQQAQFDVKTDENQHLLAQPEAGKAIVYIFRVEKRTPNVSYLGKMTMRVGTDGAWVGANRDNRSYFSFLLDPGDHHLCTDFDSNDKNLSKLGAATSFSAEAGKVYYFRAEAEFRTNHETGLTLEPVDPAEGQFLVASSSLSISHPKK